MKIVTNKTYKDFKTAIDNYFVPFSGSKTYKQKYEEIQKELEEARNLKSILERVMTNPLNIGKDGQVLSFSGGTFSWADVILPDNVLQYTDDMLGGKVIKQEANKVIEISLNGDVRTGLTKQPCDKGYGYKLIRQSK